MTDNQRQHFGPRIKAIRLAKKMTLEEFYSPIAKHVNNFSPIENGARKIGKRLSEDVIKYYRINAEWLGTGKGDMFLHEKTIPENSIEKPSCTEGVPFINISPSEISAAGFNLLRAKPEYYINFKPFNDCYAYLPVYGESMFPKYASGEIIAIKEIVNKEVIQWGEAYLLSADKRANYLTTVKLLFEHDDNSKVILRSANPDYKGDTIIDKSAIERLFIIKGKITRNHL